MLFKVRTLATDVISTSIDTKCSYFQVPTQWPDPLNSKNAKHGTLLKMILKLIIKNVYKYITAP